MLVNLILKNVWIYRSRAYAVFLGKAAGFFDYGPQCLIGLAAATLAAATAAGLTGLFGYLSTILSGWGLGAPVERHGWDAGFLGLLVVAAIATLLFAGGWVAKAHGYKRSVSTL